jgi:hypothetical protein
MLICEDNAQQRLPYICLFRCRCLATGPHATLSICHYKFILVKNYIINDKMYFGTRAVEELMVIHR